MVPSGPWKLVRPPSAGPKRSEEKNQPRRWQRSTLFLGRMSKYCGNCRGKHAGQHEFIWTDQKATSLAPHLNAECPNGLRFGRRLKTKFRLGCHHLRCRTSRMENIRDITCECCKSGEIETVQHTMLHCPAFAKERKGFLERACAVRPGFDAMSRPNYSFYVLNFVYLFYLI